MTKRDTLTHAHTPDTQDDERIIETDNRTGWQRKLCIKLFVKNEQLTRISVNWCLSYYYHHHHNHHPSDIRKRRPDRFRARHPSATTTNQKQWICKIRLLKNVKFKKCQDWTHRWVPKRHIYSYTSIAYNFYLFFKFICDRCSKSFRHFGFWVAFAFDCQRIHREWPIDWVR